ncbi:hypothetical protein [Nonomuraea sp. SBT364]|uniref:hypothetical protein n=1 Tax=Nonomuraea sp. SBT364 TaxID=1580530 RepID=UPI00066D8A23|nr:hypothetical protein [Nonomuraea sp. SBT364]
MTLTIAAFWPPPPHETTEARYRQIADAGIDLVITGNYVNDPVAVKHALRRADEAGLDVLVASDPRIDVLMRDLDPGEEQTVALIGRVIGDYRAHRSFRGISLMDEPLPDRFERLATGVSAVRSHGYLPYVNLLPSHATGPYDEYVRDFVSIVRPALLSFDRYPFLSSGEDAGYFADLATIRAHAAEAEVPAWMYVQTLAYDGHRTPTAAELAWQVNTALAYGYTGIQYFTYWTPDPSRGEGFRPALIDDGLPTERYDAVRELNTRWLRPVGEELKSRPWGSAGHTGPVPDGARPLQHGLVVSGEVVAGRYGERHLFVCNARHDAATDVTLAARAAAFDPATRSYDPCPSAFTLDPGAARLLRLES